MLSTNPDFSIISFSLVIKFSATVSILLAAIPNSVAVGPSILFMAACKARSLGAISSSLCFSLKVCKLVIAGAAAFPTTCAISPPGCASIPSPTFANSKNFDLLISSVSGFNCSWITGKYS